MALLALAFALATLQLLQWLHHGDFFHPESPMLYSAATGSFNYPEFGAVRRGLFGTLIYLLHDNRMIATALFHALSALALCAAAAWIFSRIRARPITLLLFAVLLLSLARRWGDDTGRADLAIATLLSLGAILTVRGHFGAAGAIVGLSAFGHETGVIYGAPLMLALLLDRQRYAQLDRNQWLRLALGLGLPLIGYVLLGRLPHADHATMVSTVREALPHHKYVDWAIYYATSGWRGVETSLCQNHTDPNYLQHLLSAFLLLLLFVFALTGRARRLTGLAMLAAAPPLIFLAVVANDMTRWTEFAAYNAWLVCAFTGRQPDEASDSRVRVTVLRVLAALAFLVLFTDTKRFYIRERFYAPAPIVEHIAVERLKLTPTPNLDLVLLRCDPGWRDFLDAPAAAPAGR
jgi:hypothetical protein